MGNLLSSLGFGGEDSTIWIIIIVVILLFAGNGNGNGLFGGNNSCDPCGDKNDDWTWIIIVVVILLLCNGNNGLLGGVFDNKKPC